MTTMYPTEESVLHDCENDIGENFELDLDDLNMTSEDIDFDEIDDDLERFQEDEMVQQALQRGVDLRKYGQELAAQLKEVISQSTGLSYLSPSIDSHAQRRTFIHHLIHIICYICDLTVQAEAETVAQYIENSGDVVELNDQMEACDTVLARMQEMLLGTHTSTLLLYYYCCCY
jgi:hypothetical protein